MKINSMDDFQKICREKLIEWYSMKFVTYENTFIVWSSKTLQNYKCLVSTSNKDGIYAEFTYNGDKEELYMDVYSKVSNKCTR